MSKPIWIAPKKKYQELDRKKVQFRFAIKQGLFADAVGNFILMPHNNDPSKIAITIQTNEPHASGGNRNMTFFLDQRLADKIEPHPNQSIAHFRCLE